MLSYATIGVTDLEKSEFFYNELLAPIGAKTLIKMERIIFIGKSMKSLELQFSTHCFVSYMCYNKQLFLNSQN